MREIRLGRNEIALRLHIGMGLIHIDETLLVKLLKRGKKFQMSRNLGIKNRLLLIFLMSLLFLASVLLLICLLLLAPLLLLKSLLLLGLNAVP
jgi:hypothetical protein